MVLFSLPYCSQKVGGRQHSGVGHSVMIWAKSYQVFGAMFSALRFWRDVMNMHDLKKPADSASPIVSFFGSPSVGIPRIAFSCFKGCGYFLRFSGSATSGRAINRAHRTVFGSSFRGLSAKGAWHKEPLKHRIVRANPRSPEIVSANSGAERHSRLAGNYLNHLLAVRANNGSRWFSASSSVVSAKKSFSYVRFIAAPAFAQSIFQDDPQT